MDFFARHEAAERRDREPQGGQVGHASPLKGDFRRVAENDRKIHLFSRGDARRIHP